MAVFGYNPMSGMNPAYAMAGNNPMMGAPTNHMPYPYNPATNFNTVVGGALNAAFGGNTTPGPISHLVDRLGNQLVRGGYGNLAGLLPNYRGFNDHIAPPGWLTSPPGTNTANGLGTPAGALSGSGLGNGLTSPLGSGLGGFGTPTNVNDLISNPLGGLGLNNGLANGINGLGSGFGLPGGFGPINPGAAYAALAQQQQQQQQGLALALVLIGALRRIRNEQRDDNRQNAGTRDAANPPRVVRQVEAPRTQQTRTN